MTDKYHFHEAESETEQQQASCEQIENAREVYPKTPEHFKKKVEQAVEMHTSAAGNGKDKGQKHKKIWKRIWLPIAATLALGCGAVAAGNLWLKPYLTERGFSEQDAGQLIVTEPEQKTTELENITYSSGEMSPVKKKDWEGPLLKVTEACFDGNSLYFIGEGSSEADNFDLHLRDHASLNGYDGVASLQKLKEGSLYLGRIELADKNAGADILNAGTVEVEMTAIAYPKYEGRIFYAWKDVEAYKKIYGIGAFQSEYTGDAVCYALPMEGVITGYTPYTINVQISMTKDTRQMIEKYIAEGKLTWENQLPDTAADAEIRSTDGNFMNDGTTAAMEDNAENTYQGAQINGTHVSCELSGLESSLRIDAEITQMSQEVYTGTLKAEPIDIEQVQALYTAGTSDQWVDLSENGCDNWKYEGHNIFASSDCEITHYQNDEITQNSPLEKVEAGQEIEFCQQILRQLGMEGIVEEQADSYDEHVKYYRAQRILEGLPVAWNSQWHCSNSVCLESGSLAYATTSSQLIVLEKEKADLMDMEELLEKAAEYIAAGKISLNEAAQPVKEISLEYYVDLTKQGLVFRPIWNFQYSSVIGEGEEAHASDMFFYMDGITGALIRDTFGYR